VLLCNLSPQYSVASATSYWKLEGDTDECSHRGLETKYVVRPTFDSRTPTR
jgi:hypothetical protein